MSRFYIKPLPGTGFDPDWGVFDNDDDAGRYVRCDTRTAASTAARALNLRPHFVDAFDWTKD